jgi:hypothetical protein
MRSWGPDACATPFPAGWNLDAEHRKFWYAALRIADRLPRIVHRRLQNCNDCRRRRGRKPVRWRRERGDRQEKATADDGENGLHAEPRC